MPQVLCGARVAPRLRVIHPVQLAREFSYGRSMLFRHSQTRNDRGLELKEAKYLHLRRPLALRSMSTAPESSSRRVPIGSRRKEIRTLRPDRFFSLQQPILDVANLYAARVKVQNARSNEDSVVSMAYSRGYNPIPFPPHGQGVFYYHAAESQLRFRLCQTLDMFNDGTDLERPDGSVWRVRLQNMARYPDLYRPILDLLQQEFDIADDDVDPNRDAYRALVTLSPRRFVSADQRVFNISGILRPIFKIAGERMYITYETVSESGKSRFLPFPAGTSGVFYYHQSQTAPTRLGELRFRLCSDVQDFDQGADLLLPSGSPWFLSSHSISCQDGSKPMAKLLAEEGLLDADVYSRIPKDVLLALRLVPYLANVNEPFAVDLSREGFTVYIHSKGPPAISVPLRMRNVFSPHKGGKSSFGAGRAIVRFEEYPKVGYGSVYPKRALLTLRILEILAPVKIVRGDYLVPDPVPGQLLKHRYHGHYVPYGYSPFAGELQEKVKVLIQRSKAESKS